MTNPDSSLVAAAWSQLWQVAAVILIVGAVVRALCQRRPHLAHVLWVLVILKCLTPPLWSSPTGVFTWLEALIASTPIFTTDAPPMHICWSQAAEGASVNLIGKDISNAIAGESAAPNPNSSTIQVIVVFWLSGLIVCGSVVAARWLQWRSILRRSCAEVDPALFSFTAGLARRLGIRRRVRVVVTSSPYGPAALGLFSPTVLLPASLAGKAPGELEPILAHELIHFRRGDNLFGVLQLLAQLVWWFHPLVWWANRQASRALERCCDEEVVAGLGCEPAVYARCLLDVLELKESLRAVYLSPGMRPAEVTAQRLESIMKRANGFHRRTPKWCWALLALAAALVLPGKEIICAPNQAEAQAPAASRDAPARMPEAGRTTPALKREAIPIHCALAADVAAALKEIFPKKLDGQTPADPARRDGPVIIAEPNSNTLFVVASPGDFAEIRRLVAVLDVPAKQFHIQVRICEGEPAPTFREARKKGKVDLLCHPQILTVANQTALINIGKEVEFPAGSGQNRHVGITLQVTVDRANDKRVPVRMVTEVSSLGDQDLKDRATLNIQHTEHTAVCPLGQPIRVRGGMTSSGKELWTEMTVTEITSREQLEKLNRAPPDDE